MIARDKVGIGRGFTPQLAMYENKPFQSDIKEGMFFCEGFYVILPSHYFPEVTFENSPMEIELVIKRKMDKISFEYGAMSSRYRLYAENKYTAYAAMCCHFKMSAHLIALYEPVDVVKDDSWLNPFGAIADRLDEIYGGQGEFDKYFDSHIELIREAYETIEQIC